MIFNGAQSSVKISLNSVYDLNGAQSSVQISLNSFSEVMAACAHSGCMRDLVVLYQGGAGCMRGLAVMYQGEEGSEARGARVGL